MLDKKHNMCYIINRPEEVNKIEKEMSDMTLEDKIKNGEIGDVRPNGIEEIDEVQALGEEVKKLMKEKKLITKNKNKY